MNTYETLVYLATEPYEKKLGFRAELNSSEAILNELKQEFYQCRVDTRQASEIMVYQN